MRRSLLLAAALVVSAAAASGYSDTLNSVQLDLNTGVVRGYSPFVKFLQPPSTSYLTKCSHNSVIKLDFTSNYKAIRISFEFNKPRRWLLHLSDSLNVEGYGQGNSTSELELHVINRQLRLYGPSEDVEEAEVTSHRGIRKILDGTIRTDAAAEILLSAANPTSIIWHDGRLLQNLPMTKTTLSELYLGVNRALSGPWSPGSGLCFVNITMLRTEDECGPESECHVHAVCRPTRRAAQRCVCKAGWEGDGKVCRDIDECRIKNGGCAHSCINTPGSFHCECLHGFTPDVDDPSNCVDVNECTDVSLQHPECQERCINTIGSYHCACNSKLYTIDPLAPNRCVPTSRVCLNHSCEHGCEDRGGTARCWCRRHHLLDAYDLSTCRPTCRAGNGGCQHRCLDESGGPLCTCAHKYLLGLDGKTCAPSCAVNNGGCHKHCSNTDVGVVCTCPNGFLLDKDGKTCRDIDECQHGGVGSSCENSCINTVGGFECTCPEGLKLRPDERTCYDVDECELSDSCDHNCTNTHGSYTCDCKPGYQLFGHSHCGDIDECSINNGGCQQRCFNTPGSFHCGCHDGYRLHHNQKDCTEATSCAALKPPPKTELSCHRSRSALSCAVRCQSGASPTSQPRNLTCGIHTDFHWQHGISRGPVLACSETTQPPNYVMLAKMLLTGVPCLPEGNVSSFASKVVSQISKQQILPEGCYLAASLAACEQSHKALQRVGLPRGAVTRVMLKVTSEPYSLDCNEQDCVAKETLRMLNYVMMSLRKESNAGRLTVTVDGKNITIIPKTFKAQKNHITVCPRGLIKIGETCVGCGVGSYFNDDLVRCLPCPAGTYQDKEGQFDCATCADSSTNRACLGLCSAGSYSLDGIQPCTLCPAGTYQPDIGRTSCKPCGKATSVFSGAITFEECTVKEPCKPGHYLNANTQTCEPCPKGTFQPNSGLNFCQKCPENSTTDGMASLTVNQCKRTYCRSNMTELYGYIESPNYPGDYPGSVECSWSIKPGKGRRLLIIIPGLQLEGRDCGDQLVMRKSKSAFSMITYEACSSRPQPVAVTARSKNVWIQFKSDANGSAQGFRIPFVTYNEEYHSLIEDIVQDNRLYALHNHREILKDRKLLDALMEVIAQPINYYKYASEQRNMFPGSFIRLMTPKVRRFFSNRRRRSFKH